MDAELYPQPGALQRCAGTQHRPAVDGFRRQRSAPVGCAESPAELGLSAHLVEELGRRLPTRLAQRISFLRTGPIRPAGGSGRRPSLSRLLRVEFFRRAANGRARLPDPAPRGLQQYYGPLESECSGQRGRRPHLLAAVRRTEPGPEFPIALSGTAVTGLNRLKS